MSALTGTTAAQYSGGALFLMQGESMDAEPARLIIEALKEEKIDLYVTLPEEPTVSLTQAVQAIKSLWRPYHPLSGRAAR